MGTADVQPGRAPSPIAYAPPPAVERSQDYQRRPTAPLPHDMQDDYTAAINEATPTALESGQPEKWSAAGRHGYVVPSSPQVYGDRTCRNISSTIFNGGEQTGSAAVKWCRMAEGGNWELPN
jgi:surface antigen